MKLRKAGPSRKICRPCNHRIHAPGHCSAIWPDLCPCKGPNSREFVTTEAARAALQRKTRAREVNARGRGAEEMVLAIAKEHRFLAFHVRPARRKDGSWYSPIMGDVGFPDYIFAFDPSIGARVDVFGAEIKTGKATLADGQRVWKHALEHRIPVYEWHWPEDEAAIRRRFAMGPDA